MTLGQQIAHLRKASHLTMADLQRLCGWGDGSTNSRINNYEKDRSEPSLNDLRIIAAALSVDISHLINSTDAAEAREQRATAENLGQELIGRMVARPEIQVLIELVLEKPTPSIPSTVRPALQSMLSGLQEVIRTSLSEVSSSGSKKPASKGR